MNASKKALLFATLFVILTALSGCAGMGYPYGYGYRGGSYGYTNQPYYGYGNYGAYGFGRSGYRWGHRDDDDDRRGNAYNRQPAYSYNNQRGYYGNHYGGFHGNGDGPFEHGHGHHDRDGDRG